MSTDCVITFDDKPNGLYNSGENLNGKVKLVTEKSKSIRGISIAIVGYGKVRWSESRGKSNTTFTAHEQFLNSVTYVIGSVDGDSFDIASGIYQYTFQCHLPIELPSTVAEQFGKIKYKVIVTINRRFKFDNVFKKDFIVNHVSDLNDYQNINLPRRNTGIKTIAPLFGCWCFSSYDIKAELSIQFGGYVPGQQILFKLSVFNNSNIDLSGAKVKIIKCCTFKSSGPRSKERQTEVYITFKNIATNIPRQTNKEYHDFIVVPNLQPTTQTNHIRIDYKLVAKIRVFGYACTRFNVDVPITLGTIPFS